MWLTIYKALQEVEGDDPSTPPVHCPHPAACLRLPLGEARSFSPPSTTRTLMLDRYRRLMARQCACNAHRQEMKI